MFSRVIEVEKSVLLIMQINGTIFQLFINMGQTANLQKIIEVDHLVKENIFRIPIVRDDFNEA